jgi:hypothetical protein
MKSDGNAKFGAILKLAAQEATRAHYEEITPAHLLIALSRFADPSLSEAADGDALRAEFELLGVEPVRFRRRLRGLIGQEGAGATRPEIHRSPECRAVFACAQAVALRLGTPPGPEHLLQATLLLLALGVPPEGPETECLACRAKMRPLVVHGTTHCSACGQKVPQVVPAKPGPQDIPSRL